MKKAAKPPYQSLFLFFIYSISSILLLSCNNSSGDKKEESTTTETKSAATSAVAVLTGTKTDTTVNGTATFTQDGGKVKLDLAITVPALANHSVAVHIHEHGDCGAAGMNTHGHWNPTGKQHGKWGTGEFHSGDIGNVSLDAEGKGTISIDTDLWSIGGTSNTDILNKAVIVHSGVDDYTSQPAGNAGSRIGCGLIEKK